MNTVQDILDKDDRNPGSFGVLEKGIGYTTLIVVTIPILLLPYLFVLVKRNILKLTALLMSFLLLLFLVFRFRFSWVVWLDNRLHPYYHA